MSEPTVDVLYELRRQGVTGSVYYAVAELIEREKAQREALTAFVELAKQRKAELGELSPEMDACLAQGVTALARVGGA